MRLANIQEKPGLLDDGKSSTIVSTCDACRAHHGMGVVLTVGNTNGAASSDGRHAAPMAIGRDR
jgi:hypothetical protein